MIFKKSFFEVNIDFIPDFGSTYVYFDVILRVMGGSEGVLGRLGRVLARLSGFLGRLSPAL